MDSIFEITYPKHIKQHHEDHKHESLCLTPNLFLDFTYNPRHILKLDLWEFEKFHNKKLHAKKEKKMAYVKPNEKIKIKNLLKIVGVHE